MKLADNKTAIPASRMSILQGKITRYRDKKKENDKKKEKDAAARMKELQKQQDAMQGPQSAADRMRENFNQFAGSNFAGNSPTALPTVQAPTPVSNQQQKQAAFYKKASELIKSIDVLKKKFASKEVAIKNKKGNIFEQVANNPNQPSGVRVWAQDLALKNDPSIPKGQAWQRFAYNYGPMVLKILGLNRTDDRKNLDGEPRSVHATNINNLGDITPFLQGYNAVRGYTTPYRAPRL